jgi:hypothetical protein
MPDGLHTLAPRCREREPSTSSALGQQQAPRDRHSDRADWTPAAKCQAVTGKTNFEVVVYPGATSTRLLKSLATSSGITWSTMKRRRRTPKSVLTPSWMHERSRSAILLTTTEPNKARKNRAAWPHGSFASASARSTSRAKPAVVKGDPRFRIEGLRRHAELTVRC